MDLGKEWGMPWVAMYKRLQPSPYEGLLVLGKWE